MYNHSKQLVDIVEKMVQDKETKIETIIIEDETPNNTMTNVNLVSTKLEYIVSTKKDKGGKAPKSIKYTLIDTSKPIIIQIMGILRLERKEKM